MKNLLFLIFLIGQLTAAAQNNCLYYKKYMDKGDAELKKGSKANFKAAIDAYSTAMLHCPDRAEEARGKILAVFTAIEKLKIEAEDAQKQALIEKTNAEYAQKKAVESDSITTIALGKMKEATEETKLALLNLQITADQALAIVLPDIDRNIYRLEYDVTYPKCQTALNLKARRREVEKRVWEMAYFYTEADSAAAAIAFLNLLNPSGLNAGTADVQAKLRAYLAATVPANYLDSLKERYYPKLVLVEGGSFLREDSAQVQVDRFYMGKTEITYWQFNVFARAKKHHIEPPAWEFAGDNPAVHINWYDAASYLNWLSDQRGKKPVYEMTNPGKSTWGTVYDVEIDATANGYRLPTEAEWEFAARGGKNSRGYEYSGDSELTNVGWYFDNSNSRTHAVGQKKANELGLYDMSGNAWEWCQDWYEDYDAGQKDNPSGPKNGSSRVLRGGGWYGNAEYCRSASRYSGGPVPRADASRLFFMYLVVAC